MSRLVAVLIAVVVAGAACAQGSVDVGVDSVAGGGGRLAILRPTGALVTVDSAGAAEELVADSGARLPLAVTWSLGGERLAWSEVDADGPHVQVDTAGDVQRIDTPFLSFFLMWDRQGSEIAALGNGGEGTALVTLADGAASEIVTSGAPLYLSWAPDGGRLAARRSDEVGLVDPPGGISVLEGQPAPFATSSWLIDGRVVFSFLDGDDTVVSVATPDGDDAEVVFRSEGPVQVVADDSGRRLAVASFSPLEGDRPELVPARFAPNGARAQDSEAAGVGLYVVDLESGEIANIFDQPGLWWSWSPAGDRLLVLTPSSNPAQASWWVYDGESVQVAVDTFAPTRDFITNYVPFAAQWDQAIDLWAPDGQSFAFAAVDLSGDPGIFVHELDSGRLTNIGPGYFVTWSPVD